METFTLHQLTKIVNNSTDFRIKPSEILLKKLVAAIIFIISDIFAVALSFIVTLQITNIAVYNLTNSFDELSVFFITVFIFPIAFYLRRLYPGLGIDVIDELRGLTYSCSNVFIGLIFTTFFFEQTSSSIRLIFGLSWALSLILLPICRSITRTLFCKKKWWGLPVIILGAGNTGERIIKTLIKHPRIGLRPVVAIDDDIDKWGYIEKIPVIGGLAIIPELIKKLSLDYAIVAIPNANSNVQEEIILKYSKYFDKTIIIPDLFGTSSIWITAKNFGAFLGFELQQKLLKKSALIQKRIFDIIISFLLILLSLPFTIIVAILIKIDSKGTVFFKQERMGQNDVRFNLIKFRTMYSDSEYRLQTILNQDEEMRAEYNKYHKLKNDPRMTRIGKVLRKFSIDEVPQFFNVLKGDMSLLGPRAYIAWEKPKMLGQEDIILSVKQGISGLWQIIENRDESTFTERVSIDVYYIRNWSLFLDFYIVARTIAVVVLGKNG
ncbi:MAG TPA: undecaprenyl-phosphate galactose phosphotransferase WbaP [Candidatus Kapabacteria bacterium]|nr:undecaprenyl-phosphate galactose phosphotransferase WbaP [Candidatus Kapabacteria bacterium]HPO63242.1 undecaprenyl-phosphate galactose phosphotransferase WbaP [Candidatus Kapabacteria bacterium]